MHWVKKINSIDGYKISLTFNDKKIKIVDIEPYLDKGIFLDLKDQEYFKCVKVIDDTIVWPNDTDFCPDVLYELGKEVKEKESIKKNITSEDKPSPASKKFRKDRPGH